MDFGFTTAAYVVAAVLFILSLGGLSGQESAKRAVWYGIVGMALAVAATLIGPGSGLWLLSAILIAGGGIIGWYVAKKVEMTEMPQLVAAMHSLVGLAAVFVGYNAHITMARLAGGAEPSASSASWWPISRASSWASSRSSCSWRLHRRRDLHRLGHRLWQAGGQGHLEGRETARRAPAEHRRGGDLGAVPGVVHVLGRHPAADPDDPAALFIGYHLIMASAAPTCRWWCRC